MSYNGSVLLRLFIACILIVASAPLTGSWGAGLRSGHSDLRGRDGGIGKPLGSGDLSPEDSSTYDTRDSPSYSSGSSGNSSSGSGRSHGSGSAGGCWRIPGYSCNDLAFNSLRVALKICLARASTDSDWSCTSDYGAVLRQIVTQTLKQERDSVIEVIFKGYDKAEQFRMIQKLTNDAAFAVNNILQADLNKLTPYRWEIWDFASPSGQEALRRS
jgi:hypothetical protein